MKMPTSTPKVSIVIPCYNHGEFVEEAIISALSQTHKNIEIVVVNDGSTQQLTIEILRSLEEKYPEVKFLHTENQGLPSARNNGIAATTGEYILPLDADDKIAPDYVEKTLAEFAKQNREGKNVGVVTTDALLFGDYEQSWRLAGFSPMMQLTIQQLLATSLISKEAFNAVKKQNGYGYNPNMSKGYEDWDFWLSILDAGFEIVHLPETLFFYRKHGTSMVDGVKKNHKENFLRLIANHQENFDRNYPEAITILQEELNHAHFKLNELQQKQNSRRWLLKRFFNLILKPSR